ncbi:MAG: hypothetical protein M0R46_16925 [Candidatus Muirbacterium halophilum]|nr:hypothetical protein [Candidatus Muirbacterium halophilum]
MSKIKNPEFMIDDSVFYCKIDTYYTEIKLYKCLIVDMSKEFGSYNDWQYKLLIVDNDDKKTIDSQSDFIWKNLLEVKNYIENSNEKKLQSLKKIYDTNVAEQIKFKNDSLSKLKENYGEEYQKINREKKIERILDEDN